MYNYRCFSKALKASRVRYQVSAFTVVITHADESTCILTVSSKPFDTDNIN